MPRDAAACPICGTPGRACGGGSHPLNVIDLPQAAATKGPKMPNEQYNVNVNGMDTVLNLSPEDAKARGLTDKHKVKAADKPADKSRTPDNKGR